VDVEGLAMACGGLLGVVLICSAITHLLQYLMDQV